MENLEIRNSPFLSISLSKNIKEKEMHTLSK